MSRAVLAAFLFALVAGATRSQHPTFDAWAYTMRVETALSLDSSILEPGLWHPHHLIYEPVGVALLRFFRSLGTRLSALAMLQFASVLAAAFAIFGFGVLVSARSRRSEAPEEQGESLIAPLLLGSTFAFWYYAGEAEVYAFALAGTLAAILLLSRTVPTRLATIGSITLLVIATLFHQMVVLLAPVLLVWFARWRREPARGVLIVAAWGTLVLLAYYAAWLGMARHGAEGEPGFLSWITYYGHSSMRDSLHWGHPSATTPLSGLLGLGRALFGGHFAVALDERATAIIRRVVPGAFLVQEFGIVERLPRTLAWLSAIAATTAAAFWARAFLAAIRARGNRGLRSSAPERAALLGMWGLATAAFTVWWEADNLEFWLLSLPGLIGWMFLRTPELLHGRLAWTWLGAMVIANGIGSIGPKCLGPGHAELALFARNAQRSSAIASGRIWSGFADPYLPTQALGPLWRTTESPEIALTNDSQAGRACIWILPDSVAATLSPTSGRQVDASNGWSVWELGEREQLIEGGEPLR